MMGHDKLADGPEQAHSRAAPAVWLPSLLAFEQRPGLFAVVLREPAPVFDNLRLVLTLAVGRELAQWAPQPEQEAAARRAARFFVRTVMLRPEADHYTLLGLVRGFDPGTLREHYRMMIRLTHPDKVGHSESWPADAAARINLANDILGDEGKRLAYDSSLLPSWEAAAPLRQAPAGKAQGTARGIVRGTVRGRGGAAPDAGWSRASKVSAASMGAVGVIALFFWLNDRTEDRGSLRVRAPAATDAPLQLKAPLPTSEPLRAKAPGQEPELGAPVEIGAPVVAGGPSDSIIPVLDPAQVRRNVQTTAANALLSLRPSYWLASSPTPTRLQAAPAVAPLPQGLAPSRVLSETPFAGQHSAAQPATPERSTVAAAQVLVPARAAAAQPASATPPAPRSREALAPAAAAPVVAPPLRLGDVQPTLVALVDALHAGRADQALRSVDPQWRNAANAAEFKQAVERLLNGQRVAQVGDVRFSGQNGADSLIVSGALGLQLQDANGVTQQRALHLKAYFLQLEGRPVLTRLMASDAP